MKLQLSTRSTILNGVIFFTASCLPLPALESSASSAEVPGTSAENETGEMKGQGEKKEVEEKAPIDSINRASFLELSANGESEAAMIIFWRTSKPDAELTGVRYMIKKPTSFEWVVPPQEATGFVITPYDSGFVPDEKTDWIDFSVFTGSEDNSPSPNSWFFPFKTSDGKLLATINTASLKEVKMSDDPSMQPRTLPSRPQAQEGWTYVGLWKSTTAQWKTLYWVNYEGAASLGLRVPPVSVLPTSLTGRKIVSNFPMYLREGSSPDSEDKGRGAKLRPGTVVQVEEISVESTTDDFRIWARVTIPGELLRVNIEK